MPGFPIPFVKFREDDVNGRPLAGGKLYSYVAGTSTPLPTYTTHIVPPAAGAVANENPVIFDASGRASIYIPDGVGYKFILVDALNNLLWVEDNVQVPQVLAPAPPAQVPPGAIVLFGGTTLPGRTTAPFDWLLCDGQSVQAAMYPALYTVLGHSSYGGDTTAFLVPDLRQRFPLGKAASGTGSTLGEKGGEIDHTHPGPSHTHTIDAHAHNIATHTHSVPHGGWSTTATAVSPLPGVLQAGGQTGGGPETSVTQANAPNVTGGSSVAETSSLALTTKADGIQQTGPKNPPFLTVHFIIKT